MIRIEPETKESIIISVIAIMIISGIIGITMGALNECTYERYISKYNPAYRVGCLITSKIEE